MKFSRSPFGGPEAAASSPAGVSVAPIEKAEAAPFDPIPVRLRGSFKVDRHRFDRCDLLVVLT